MNNELNIKEVEAVVAEFKVLFRYFSGESEQSHESPYVGSSLSLKPTKCTVFFRRCLYYIVTLNIATYFDPQGMLFKEQVTK